jgi:hypothetical protein
LPSGVAFVAAALLFLSPCLPLNAMSFRTGLRSEESLLGFVFSLAAVFTSGAPRNRCHHTIPESILDIAINKAHNPAQEEVSSNEHPRNIVASSFHW